MVGWYWLGRRRCETVHSLVLEAFSGPRPEGQVARHLNGKITDNRSINLQWGTVAQNVNDARRHGTCVYKLDRFKVAEIRQKYAEGGRSYRSLAREYGVGYPAIRCAVLRKTYKDVP